MVGVGVMEGIGLDVGEGVGGPSASASAFSRVALISGVKTGCGGVRVTKITIDNVDIKIIIAIDQ
jgi:hypothetical protein